MAFRPFSLDIFDKLAAACAEVRNRLEAILQAMGFAVEAGRDDQASDHRRDILDQLQGGKISADDAVKLLRQQR